MTAYETALLKDIHFGIHDGYDRCVLEFIDQGNEMPPPYIDVQPLLYGDGSGKNIGVEGATRFVVVRIEPGAAHNAEGHLTFTASQLKTGLDMRRIKGYALAGDFEGVLTVGLGIGPYPKVKPMLRTLCYNAYQIVVDVSHD